MAFDLERFNRKHANSPHADKPAGCHFVIAKNVSVDRKNRLVTGVVTTEDVDLDGDVLMQDGLDTSYFWGDEAKKSGMRTVYRDHDYDVPIGTCRNMRKTAQGLVCTTQITSLPIGDEMLTLMEEDIIRGQSIGFRNLESSEPTMDEMIQYSAACNRCIRKSLMLEYSITPMPCNPNALLSLQSLVAKGRVSKHTAEVVVKSATFSIAPEPRMVLAGGQMFTIN